MINKTREKIIEDFAEWAAFSAARSGCPIKSKKDLYPLIRVPDYNNLFSGSLITEKEFDVWHEKNTKKIYCVAKKNCSAKKGFSIGWAAKLINMFLKVRVYIAKEGRKNLIICIHPPIDNRLWKGIKEKYRDDSDIIKKPHLFPGIGKIKKYSTYKAIINMCRLIKKKQKYRCLIEIEELWEGTTI